MTMILRLLIFVGGIGAAEDFTYTMERSVSVIPADLIKGINRFLDRAMDDILPFIWQAAKMEKHMQEAQVYIFLDNQEQNTITIKIPVEAVTQSEIESADKTIKKILSEFRYKSVQKIAASIISSRKFIKQ